jgi:hypothetical protein
MNKLFAFLLFLLSNCMLFAQGSLIPQANEAYHTLDRLEVKTGIQAPYHAAVKGWNRSDAIRYALMLDTANTTLSVLDKSDLHYLFLDNNEWLGIGRFATTLLGTKEPVSQRGMTQMEASRKDTRFILSKRPVLKYFYQTPANFFDINDKYFHIRVNPLLNFNVSKSKDRFFFTNLRGLQVRGGVDDRIYFFMNIQETQAGFPEYVNDRFVKDKYIPGQGLVKSYNSSLLDIENGYDFLNGQGYLGYNITRHVGMQLGYGKHFIGNGHRSMILSDFSNNFFYLKFNWKVWKFHYQNLFAELTAGTHKSVPGGTLVNKKYMAAHYLSFRLLPNLELGFFETVIFSRTNQFEFQYLNPVILYRLIEHSIGSPDNILIGLNGKWNFLKRFQLYGQVMLDEFKFDELFIEKNGWWANKYGIQLGLKYYDVLGIDHLDFQVEYNKAQPYTYTFRDNTAPYTHYDQSLAHPLGANFKEMILLGRYRLNSKWLFEGRLIAATFGEDGDDENWGGDILLSYKDRQQDYGNQLGQGIMAKTLLAGFDVSYMVRHNIFLDAHVFYRDKDSEEDSRDQDLIYFGGGVRMNIGKNRMDF